jgi:hypothetical protein
MKTKRTQGSWKVRYLEKEVWIEGDGVLLARSERTLLACEPNAHLMAAAPDLLEVAKLIIKEWEAPTEGVLPGTLIARLSQYAQEARAAIAKAEGDTQ